MTSTLHDNYHLGLPAWAFPGWKDRFFTDRPSRLASYASVFNSVEGNTTFYRTPGADTVRAWCAAVETRCFRFCFKLPREVTHERRPDTAALRNFLDAIEPLEDRLGPLLVQFPATLGPDDFETVKPIFTALDQRVRFVIEVRHPAFFDAPEKLEPVLERYAAGRVMLDSRPLYEGDRSHPDVLQALHEKPDVKVLSGVYNELVLIRLILHPDVASNQPYIDKWARRVAGYLRDGIETYMMIHCPNNLHCPPLAREFHRALRGQPGMTALPDLAAWPLPTQRELSL